MGLPPRCLARAWCAPVISAVLAVSMLVVAAAYVIHRASTPSDGTRGGYVTSSLSADGLVVAPIPGATTSLADGDVVQAVHGVTLESWARSLFGAQPGQPTPTTAREGSVAYDIERNGRADIAGRGVGRIPPHAGLSGLLGDHPLRDDDAPGRGIRLRQTTARRGGRCPAHHGERAAGQLRALAARIPGARPRRRVGLLVMGVSDLRRVWRLLDRGPPLRPGVPASVLVRATASLAHSRALRRAVRRVARCWRR